MTLYVRQSLQSVVIPDCIPDLAVWITSRATGNPVTYYRLTPSLLPWVSLWCDEMDAACRAGQISQDRLTLFQARHQRVQEAARATLDPEAVSKAYRDARDSLAPLPEPSYHPEFGVGMGEPYDWFSPRITIRAAPDDSVAASTATKPQSVKTLQSAQSRNTVSQDFLLF